MERITIERMKKELLAAGWQEKNSTTWISPAGYLFKGPFGAWVKMKGLEIE
jgi:hypothetical protein